MADIKELFFNNRLYGNTQHSNIEDNSRKDTNNMNVTVHKIKVRKRKVTFGHCNTISTIEKHSSLSINHQQKTNTQNRTKTLLAANTNCNSKYINLISKYQINEYMGPFNYNYSKKLIVYRCQLSSNNNKEGCCCSCNSDAMFEVMKSLYDCYKNKNCNNCNCILCGHLPTEERHLGEIRKSLVSVGLEPSKVKAKQEMTKTAEKEMKGKTRDQKEIILKELAKSGAPLPKGKTKSEKRLIDRVRKDLGLPPPPENTEQQVKMKKAIATGIITPLEGKTTEQKENILKAQAKMGIPLPEGRTASEKELINHINTEYGLDEIIPSLEEKELRELAIKGKPLPEGNTQSEKKLIEKVRADVGLPVEPKTSSFRLAKETGLITPLKDKSLDEKEKILKGLAMQGILLPQGKTESEKKLIEMVRTDVGLPPNPKTSSMKRKYERAAKAGILLPLEGKSNEEKEKILTGLANMGIPLPVGRTKSEKALIAKIIKTTSKPLEKEAPDQKKKKAKAAGLLTPIDGKTAEEKEKILKGLAMHGIPLPEGKTTSEKQILKKVRSDLGLPPEPKTPDLKEKYAKAAEAGLLLPLEGKTYPEKEKILQALHGMGIPLPVGRTDSEKSLILRIKAKPRRSSLVAVSEKVDKTQVAPGEVGTSALPTTKRQKLDAKTAKIMKEGKGPSDECICSLLTPESERVEISKKEVVSKSKITEMLDGKSKAEKEKLLKQIAMEGIPLPDGKTISEKQLVDKVRNRLGLPPHPANSSMKKKHEKAAKAGLLKPLEGKSHKEKENILNGLADMGIILPKGRTKSEKSLIAKIKAKADKPIELIPLEQKIKESKIAGLITPLEGKSLEQKEKVLKGLAMQGIPLPEGITTSEKKTIDKVRADIGLPPEPKTQEMREKHMRAADAGLLQPLEGKTNPEKEKILKGLHNMGIPMPEGRTASEISLIAKIKESPPSVPKLPSVIFRKAQKAGLFTPLEGKTSAQKEKILRGLAMQGIPLPDGKSSSEKKLIDKVRTDLGLPPQPSTPSLKQRHDRAAAAGFLQPLQGKSRKEQEKIIKGLADMGIPLPEGRTKSEKALITKIIKTTEKPLEIVVTDQKLKKAKAAGLLTPLDGKTAEQKEKILKGLAIHGISLPEGKTTSEKQILKKVRVDLGLPPDPKTPELKEKYAKAAAVGLMLPLEGKTQSEKGNILQGLHEMGIPLPVGRTASEKSLIARIKTALPLQASSEKMRKAKAAGLLTPLEGKSPEQKKKILEMLALQGIPLPQAKTSSENILLNEIRANLGLPPEPKTQAMRYKYEKATTLGVLQPLEGKSPEQKEKILQGLYDRGIPLPEGRTASEKSLILRIKTKPRISSSLVALSEKERKTQVAPGAVGPPALPTAKRQKLDAKTAKIMKEGKGPSDECICSFLTPESERVEKSKKEGVSKTKITKMLDGKSKAEKEKLLKQIAMEGIPLPDGKTISEKQLVDKVRNGLGLPPHPANSSMKRKHEKAAKAGLLKPLEGKSHKEKENILNGLADMGITLPKGRTKSEKSLIAKIKAKAEKPVELVPLEQKIKKSKIAGLITPLEGKSLEQKEKILKGLAMHGIPLPEGTTTSEKKIIEKVRADFGLPPEPKTHEMGEKYIRAADIGLLQPLEGKTYREKENILKGLHDMGIPLPEGRTASEKSLITRIKASPAPPKLPSEMVRKAKAAGLLTPLEGKTSAQKEKILRGLAMQGIPLPAGKTESEKKIIDTVRADLGLPPQPETPSMKRRHDRAAAAGLLIPLEGKSLKEKERIINGLADMGISLPEGRTKSEKAMITKIRKSRTKPLEIVATDEKFKKAKAAGLLTPLDAKTSEQKEKMLKGLAMHGIYLPEGKTTSEKQILKKVRSDLGLPPEPKTPELKEKYAKAAEAGLMLPLEGKTYSEKEKILQKLHDMDIPLPAGRTASEKSLINKIKVRLHPSKPVGLLTPLEGKTLPQKEKILRRLAMEGSPLPEGKTISEKKLINQVRTDLGLPPEPVTPSMKRRHERAAKAGLLQPLEGKSHKEKEIILKGLADMGIKLPKGRTKSEKELIAKIKTIAKKPLEIMPRDDRAKKAKADGYFTPLEGKTIEQKEKILKGLAMHGILLPEGKTASEKNIVDKVRFNLGLPPEAKTPEMREKYVKAADAGLLQPLEGKSYPEKQKILQGLHDRGIPLPVGRTASEKSLIARINLTQPLLTPSEKMRRAKAAGLLTPLKDKSTEQREKILKGMAMQVIALPEGKTISEKKLIHKIRADLGLPPEPKTQAMRDNYLKAANDGVLQPLQDKTLEQKEIILQSLYDRGIPLPEGRTASEKSLIQHIKSKSRKPYEEIKSGKLSGIPKEIAPTAFTPAKRQKLNAKTAKVLKEGKGPSDECICSLLTPEFEGKEKQKKKTTSRVVIDKTLEGKSKSEKEKLMRELATQGMPLPETKTVSEKKLAHKIRKELGLPPEPKTSSIRIKHEHAAATGVLKPLEGLSKEEKEKVLKTQAAIGIPLPEGRSKSEKSLIAKIKGEKKPIKKISTKKLRKAKADGLLTPLEGKTKKEKEKILKRLVEAGISLPEVKTSSERELIDKLRFTAGLPPKLVLTKTKKIGITPSKEPEIEEIVKTTTCDKACGCDKKKIRFKHSYVKIRVTSPDISEICPCPDECYPLPKPIIVNEGIKVTVGRAIGVPSYANVYSNLIPKYTKNTTYYNLTSSSDSSSTSISSVKKIFITDNKTFHTSSISSENSDPEFLPKANDNETDKFNHNDIKFGDLLDQVYKESTSTSSRHFSYKHINSELSLKSSFDTFLVIKTESSLSFCTNSDECLSIISSTQYLYCQVSNESINESTNSSKEIIINGLDYTTFISDRFETPDQFVPQIFQRKTNSTPKNKAYNHNKTNFNISHSNFTRLQISRNSGCKDPVIVIDHIYNEQIIQSIIELLVTKGELCNASSIFVVMPTSDDDNKF